MTNTSKARFIFTLISLEYLVSFIWIVIAQRRQHSTCLAFGIPQRSHRHPPPSFARLRRTQLYLTEIISNPEKILSKDQVDLLVELVEERANARLKGDYRTADTLRQKFREVVKFPPGVSISIKDTPRKEGGGSTWNLIRETRAIQPLHGNTVLQLAHKALGLVVASSEKGIEVDRIRLNQLLQHAHDRLQKIPEVELELRGRKSADAALWFSLAGGITSSESNGLLHALANVAAKELKRFGSRKSCHTKDVLQITERFAAAGLHHHKELEESAFAALQSKEQYALSNTTQADLLDFHSRRCLMMLWKFSTRQRKQRAFLEMARNHWLCDQSQHSEVESSQNTTGPNFDWEKVFVDPTKPLVVDIGCGMGVSMLGLSKETRENDGLLVDDWTKCNFAGVDLSNLNIAYANGLASCWEIDDKLHFFRDSAEEFVEKKLKSYPGPVILCLIQFPTPYKLPLKLINEENNSGNHQLPANAIDKNFMVSRNLLQNIEGILSKEHRGKLLIQSNCEDVAVWIRNLTMESCNFENALTETSRLYYEEDQNSSSGSIELVPTKRTIDWITMSGDDLERAQGPDWCSRPVLPPKGRTETELACVTNGTPIHRCLLTIK